eukprot:SAG11_NODE_120_length_15879_cov_8.076933_7_plen_2461_part_00
MQGGAGQGNGIDGSVIFRSDPTTDILELGPLGMCPSSLPGGTRCLDFGTWTDQYAEMHTGIVVQSASHTLHTTTIDAGEAVVETTGTIIAGALDASVGVEHSNDDGVVSILDVTEMLTVPAITSATDVVRVYPAADDPATLMRSEQTDQAAPGSLLTIAGQAADAGQGGDLVFKAASGTSAPGRLVFKSADHVDCADAVDNSVPTDDYSECSVGYIDETQAVFHQFLSTPAGIVVNGEVSGGQITTSTASGTVDVTAPILVATTALTATSLTGSATSAGDDDDFTFGRAAHTSGAGSVFKIKGQAAVGATWVEAACDDGSNAAGQSACELTGLTWSVNVCLTGATWDSDANSCDDDSGASTQAECEETNAATEEACEQTGATWVDAYCDDGHSATQEACEVSAQDTGGDLIFAPADGTVAGQVKIRTSLDGDGADVMSVSDTGVTFTSPILAHQPINAGSSLITTTSTVSAGPVTVGSASIAENYAITTSAQAPRLYGDQQSTITFGGDDGTDFILRRATAVASTWSPAACDDGSNAADEAACELTGLTWNSVACLTGETWDDSASSCSDGGSAATQEECEETDAANQAACEQTGATWEEGSCDNGYSADQAACEAGHGSGFTLRGQSGGQTRDGGDVFLTMGAGDGAGTDGRIVFTDADAAESVVLNAESVHYYKDIDTVQISATGDITTTGAMSMGELTATTGTLTASTITVATSITMEVLQPDSDSLEFGGDAAFTLQRPQQTNPGSNGRDLQFEGARGTTAGGNVKLKGGDGTTQGDVIFAAPTPIWEPASCSDGSSAASQSECEQTGATWNEAACTDGISQTLSICQTTGETWIVAVCDDGGGASSQSDCEQTGFTWDGSSNSCSSGGGESTQAECELTGANWVSEHCSDGGSASTEEECELTGETWNLAACDDGGGASDATSCELTGETWADAYCRSDNIATGAASQEDCEIRSPRVTLSPTSITFARTLSTLSIDAGSDTINGASVTGTTLVATTLASAPLLSASQVTTPFMNSEATDAGNEVLSVGDTSAIMMTRPAHTAGNAADTIIHGQAGQADSAGGVIKLMGSTGGESLLTGGVELQGPAGNMCLYVGGDGSVEFGDELRTGVLTADSIDTTGTVGGTTISAPDFQVTSSMMAPALNAADEETGVVLLGDNDPFLCVRPVAPASCDDGSDAATEDDCERTSATWIEAACNDGSNAADEDACELTGLSWAEDGDLSDGDQSACLTGAAWVDGSCDDGLGAASEAECEQTDAANQADCEQTGATWIEAACDDGSAAANEALCELTGATWVAADGTTFTIQGQQGDTATNGGVLKVMGGVGATLEASGNVILQGAGATSAVTVSPSAVTVSISLATSAIDTGASTITATTVSSGTTIGTTSIGAPDLVATTSVATPLVLGVSDAVSVGSEGTAMVLQRSVRSDTSAGTVLTLVGQTGASDAAGGDLAIRAGAASGSGAAGEVQLVGAFCTTSAGAFFAAETEDECLLTGATWVEAACDDGSNAADEAACELTGLTWDDGNTVCLTGAIWDGNNNICDDGSGAANQVACEQTNAASENSCEQTGSTWVLAACAGNNAASEDACILTGATWYPAACDDSSNAADEDACELTGLTWSVNVCLTGATWDSDANSCSDGGSAATQEECEETDAANQAACEQTGATWVADTCGGGAANEVACEETTNTWTANLPALSVTQTGIEIAVPVSLTAALTSDQTIEATAATAGVVAADAAEAGTQVLATTAIQTSHINPATTVLSVGDDDAWTVARPEHSSGAGTSMTVAGQAAATGSDADGGDLILKPGAEDGSGNGGQVAFSGEQGGGSLINIRSTTVTVPSTTTLRNENGILNTIGYYVATPGAPQVVSDDSTTLTITSEMVLLSCDDGDSARGEVFTPNFGAGDLGQIVRVMNVGSDTCLFENGISAPSFRLMTDNLAAGKMYLNPGDAAASFIYFANDNINICGANQASSCATGGWYQQTEAAPTLCLDACAADSKRWCQHESTYTSTGVTGVAASDLNGDGMVDLVSSSSASSTEGEIIWYKMDVAGGAQWTQYTVDALAVGAIRVVLGDFDNDGDTDIATATTDGGGTLQWYEYTGVPASCDGTFTSDDGQATACTLDEAETGCNDDSCTYTQPFFATAATITTSLGAITGLEVGDVDGIGPVDLIVATGGSSGEISFHCAGDVTSAVDCSSPPRTTLALNLDFDDIAVGDIDSDGDLDVASITADTHIVQWYENNGASFEDGVSISDAPTAEVGDRFKVILMDMAGEYREGCDDSDRASTYGCNFKDIVVTSPGNGRIYAWNNQIPRGSAIGLPWAFISLTSSATGVTDIVAADISGDGRDDIVATGTEMLQYFVTCEGVCESDDPGLNWLRVEASAACSEGSAYTTESDCIDNAGGTWRGGTSVPSILAAVDVSATTRHDTADGLASNAVDIVFGNEVGAVGFYESLSSTCA